MRNRFQAGLLLLSSTPNKLAISAAGRPVGAKLVTLAVSSCSAVEELATRSGVVCPLATDSDIFFDPGKGNVPRDPSGNERVWISTGVIAVVACAGKGFESMEAFVDGRGGRGGRFSSSLEAVSWPMIDFTMLLSHIKSTCSAVYVVDRAEDPAVCLAWCRVETMR